MQEKKACKQEELLLSLKALPEIHPGSSFRADPILTDIHDKGNCRSKEKMLKWRGGELQSNIQVSPKQAKYSRKMMLPVTTIFPCKAPCAQHSAAGPPKKFQVPGNHQKCQGEGLLKKAWLPIFSNNFWWWTNLPLGGHFQRPNIPPRGVIFGGLLVTHTRHTHISSDNKVQRIFGSGKREILYTNGTVKKLLPSGHVILQFSNGDIKKVCQCLAREGTIFLLAVFPFCNWAFEHIKCFFLFIFWLGVRLMPKWVNIRGWNPFKRSQFQPISHKIGVCGFFSHCFKENFNFIFSSAIMQAQKFLHTLCRITLSLPLF